MFDGLGDLLMPTTMQTGQPLSSVGTAIGSASAATKAIGSDLDSSLANLVGSKLDKLFGLTVIFLFYDCTLCTSWLFLSSVTMVCFEGCISSLPWEDSVVVLSLRLLQKVPFLILNFETKVHHVFILLSPFNWHSLTKHISRSSL